MEVNKKKTKESGKEVHQHACKEVKSKGTLAVVSGWFVIGDYCKWRGSSVATFLGMGIENMIEYGTLELLGDCMNIISRCVGGGVVLASVVAFTCGS